MLYANKLSPEKSKSSNTAESANFYHFWEKYIIEEPDTLVSYF